MRVSGSLIAVVAASAFSCVDAANAFVDKLNTKAVTWEVSQATKHDPLITERDLLTYRGEWKQTPVLTAEERSPLEKDGKTPPAALLTDYALMADSVAAHHAIAKVFPDGPIDMSKEKEFVVQYDLTLREGQNCGGAYLKLLSYKKDFKPALFDNTSPFTVMFGPDKCGSTNKVHFIVNAENPKNKEIKEHMLSSPPPIIDDTRTNTYTLRVNADTNDVKIYINGDNVKEANLLSAMDPPIQPEEEVNDEDDLKPKDWVDLQKIADPDATKPADWDENAPMTIADPDAVKPSDWLEEEEDEIPDPEAVEPEDWDDEEDGEWLPPTIPNPKCEEHGCGPWTPPTIKNPAYKGKWTAPLIDNPAYKGEWVQKKKPNPHFYEAKTPAKAWKIGAIGIEIWTMSSGIVFDNVYVGHSFKDAEALRQETAVVRRDWEAAKRNGATLPEDKDLPTEDSWKEKASKVGAEGGSILNDYYEQYVQPVLTRVGAGPFVQRLQTFTKKVRKDPVPTIQSDPQSAGFFAFVTLLTLFIVPSFISSLFGSSSSSSKAAATPAAKKERTTSKTTGAAPRASSASKRTKTTRRTTSADDEDEQDTDTLVMTDEE